jgi:glycosyltransferase involved in cell wall biosynthesis
VRALRIADDAQVVVHLNSSVQWASLVRELGFAICARAAGAARIVLQIHGSLLESRRDGRGALRAMTWLVAALCSQLVVLSVHQAAAIGGRAGRRARVLPNAIEIAPAATRSASQSLRLLFLGRLVREKGPQLAVQALARLRAQGLAARLTIVGDGELEPTLRRQLGELGISDAVALTGPVAPSQVRALLAAHDLMLFTPLAAEGLPYVLIEALDAGTPVVATVTSDAVRELVAAADGAIVETSATPQAIAERVAALAASPSSLRALGERGRDAARARFSLEASLERWRSVWGG